MWRDLIKDRRGIKTECVADVSKLDRRIALRALVRMTSIMMMIIIVATQLRANANSFSK